MRILHGDQTGCEDNFTGSTANADARSVCGIANLVYCLILHFTVNCLEETAGLGIASCRVYNRRQWCELTAAEQPNQLGSTVVTSAEEAMFSSAFVCLFAGLCKTTQSVIGGTKLGGMAAKP